MVSLDTQLSTNITGDELLGLDPFFEHNISPLAILDRDFNFIRVNRAYAAADERQPEAFVGCNHFELYPSEENERLFRQVVASKQALRVRAKPFVYANSPERGVTHWDWSLSPVLDAAGEVRMLILSLYNVTERVQAVEALERFFALSLDALCILDSQGRFIKTNRAFGEMLGYSTEELAHKSAFDLVHPDDLVRTTEAMQTITGQGLPVIEFENRYCRKDNTYKWLQWTSVPDTAKGVSYAVARDVTGRKELERELQRLDRLNLIAEMAAAISHEVRNPMTTVRGFLQLLRSKEDCLQYREYYDLMIEELDRANAMISEFLSIGRPRVSETKMQSLNGIIETLLPLLQADAVSEGKGVQCQLGDIPDLPLNDKEIRQVVLNLVKNGLEAMPKGGQVSIRTSLEGEHVVLSIQDQGPGISQSVLEKMGTPFFTTKEGGTGLGLSTCHSIAARHKATMAVATGPTGTTVSLRFPVEAGSSQQT